MFPVLKSTYNATELNLNLMIRFLEMLRKHATGGVVYKYVTVTFCKAMGLQMMSICKVTCNKLIKINAKNYIIQNTIG